MFEFNIAENRRQDICQWRDAAIADGWSHEPSYPGIEGEDRAVRLKREGFVAQIITREDKRAYYSISVWGPDRLAVKPPYPYSWKKLNRNLLLCGQCGKYKDKVGRVGFANRVCEECMPEARRKIEFPGWTK